LNILALLSGPIVFAVAALGFFSGRLYQMLHHQAPQEEADQQIARMDETMGGLFKEVAHLTQERDEAREVARYWDRYSSAIITGCKVPEPPACMRYIKGAQS